MELSSPRPPSAILVDAGLLILLVLYGMVLGASPITNNDIWLHLATGRWMLAAGHVPVTEVFSYVAAGRPYVAHEWGSELLFIALYRAGGVLGLVLFKVAVGGLLAAWTFVAIRRRSGAPGVAAAVTGIAVFIAGAHLWARPHVFSWFAVLATVALLRRSRQKPAKLLWLLPLQIVWTNLHGSFVLGPVLILVWAVGEAWRRRAGSRADAHPGRTALIGVTCAAATLINPYGVALLRLPFELTSSRTFMSAVYEWQSPFRAGYRHTSMFAAFLLLAALFLVGWLAETSRKRGAGWTGPSDDPCEILILALAFALACRMNRNVPLFALLAAAPAAGGLTTLARRMQSALPRPTWFRTAARMLVMAGVLTVATVTWTAGYPYGLHARRARGFGLGPRVPEATVDYVEAAGLSGDAFTTYGEGAYVVWRLWPGVRVGMDSRNSVYGEDLYRQYRQALWTDAGAASYLGKWPPDLAIVGHQGPFHREDPAGAGVDPSGDIGHNPDLPHRALLQSGRFALVDFDDVSAVYVARSPEHADLIARDAYRVIHPVLLPATFPPVQLPVAIDEARRAITRHPGAVLPRWILAQAEAQAGHRAGAIDVLEQIARLDSTAIATWGVGPSFEAARLGLLGFLEKQAGDCPAARRALQDALDADPRYEPARRLLAGLDC